MPDEHEEEEVEQDEEEEPHAAARVGAGTAGSPPGPLAGRAHLVGVQRDLLPVFPVGLVHNMPGAAAGLRAGGQAQQQQRVQQRRGGKQSRCTAHRSLARWAARARGLGC